MLKKHWLKSLVFFGILSLMLLAAVGCGSGGTEKSSSNNEAEPIKIGVLTGLTGKGADWGNKQKIALQIAEKDINQGGGINGNPVKFLIYDTGGENQQAVILTRKLATEDKVLAILGPYFSGESEVAFPQANELKIPIISATSAKPGLSEANRPWAFRNSMTDDKMLNEALPLFLKKYPVKNIALVVDMKDAISKSFGTKILPSAVKKTQGLVLLKDGQPVTYNTGDTDFSAQVSTLKQLKPEAVGIGGLYQEIANLAREMKRQGLNVPAIGNVGMYSEALIEQGKGAVEGWVALSNYWPTSPDPKVKEFNEKYKATAEAAGMSPITDSFAVSMYDTAMITADILRKNNITTKTPLEEARTLIRDGWASVKDYEGVMGKTTINEVGDGIKEVYTLIVKDGKWERLE